MPIALAEPVQLLGNSGSTANNLQVELLEVLIEKCNRDVLGAHIRWIPRPWSFSQWKQSPDLLLMNPLHVDFHVAKLRYALALHYADGSDGVHADAGSDGQAAEVGKIRENPKCLA